MATIVPYGSTVLPNGTVIYPQAQPAYSPQAAAQPGVGILPNVNVNVNIPFDGIVNAVQDLAGSVGEVKEEVKPIGETFGKLGDILTKLTHLDWFGVGLAGVGVVLMVAAVILLVSKSETVRTVAKTGAKAAIVAAA